MLSVRHSSASNYFDRQYAYHCRRRSKSAALRCLVKAAALMALM